MNFVFCLFRVPTQKGKMLANERKSPSSYLSHSDEEGGNVGVIDNDSDTGSQKGGKDAKEDQARKKPNKKEKGKHKKKSEDKAKLRKEAQELRLASLSEGLGNVTFSDLNSVETDNEGSEIEKSVNKTHNGFINGKSTETSKVLKRKANEIEHDIATSKKMR